MTTDDTIESLRDRLLRAQATSETWRLAELAWQRWATTLCVHPAGELGDEPMRNQLGQIVADHRRLLSALLHMANTEQPALTEAEFLAQVFEEAERLGWEEPER